MDYRLKMEELKDYLAPEFSLKNIDRFYVRYSILRAINDYKHLLKGVLLDIGCGKMPYKTVLLQPGGPITKYIGLDLDQSISEAYSNADLFWDGKIIPMHNDAVDSVLLTEVLEHCFEPGIVIAEAYRVLRNDGSVLITVPFLWPLHDIPYDEYRYTPYSLEKLLAASGFKNIEIKGLGGWNASLGQMIGLWTNRSGINGWKRKALYTLFFRPFIKWLYKTDLPPTNFTDNVQMITGLVAYARK